ncbi:microtubule-actin cross-linking factor 1, isoforms 6/7-like isoform X2 [Watersipora subatra]|uniref:microtubule-actin cross-linking factor 1, isoforms 6/7-like isoform X2 n=1 Tax=Watersipora subatra TaxID=2589382 RepID=UPI00355B3973
MDNMSLAKAMANNMVNGEWLSPDTKAVTTLQEAIEEGYVIPETVFFVDQATGRIGTLASGIKDGHLDSLESSFISNSDSGLDDVDIAPTNHLSDKSVQLNELSDNPLPTDGLTTCSLSLPEAIAQKRISPEVKSWRFLEEEAPLIEFINAGALSDKTELIVAPDTKVQVKDALANKLLGYQTPVVMSPSTGDLRLVQTENRLLQSLLKTPELIDWLSEVELSMAREAKPHETIEGINAQLSSLQDQQQQVADKKADIDELLNNTQKLLESRPDGDKSELEQQQYQLLRIATSDLKATYEKVNKQNKAQLKRLQTMRGFLDEYKDKHDSFEDWMGEANEKIHTAGHIVGDLEHLQQHVEALELFQDEINQQDQKVLGLQTTCFKFLAEANEYEKSLDAYRETIHKPLPKGSINLSEPCLQASTDAASEEYKQLKVANLNAREEVLETIQKAQNYNELNEQLGEWLNNAKERMNDITGKPVELSNADAIKDTTSELNHLDAEIETNKATLNRLKDVAESLSAVYKESDQPTKAEELTSHVLGMSEAMEQLQAKVTDTQQQLHDKFVQSQDLSASLSSLVDFVDSTEDATRKAAGISVEREKLNKQLLEHNKLDASVRSTIMKLEALSRESDDPALTALHDRLQALACTLEGRGAKLNKMVEEITDLSENVKSLEQWIVSVVQDLQGKAATADPLSIKNHFEELYSEKKEKQPDLETIKDTISALLADPEATDKSHIRDVQSDVCSKWHDFTELLIDLIVMQALRDVEEVNNYFINCEHSLLRAENVTIEPEELQTMLREHKTLHEKLENKRDDAMEVIQKCSHMLRETTKEEGDIAKGRIEHVRSLIGSVWKMSCDRLHLLEEAVPMVQHFHEHHADIGTWLDEISNEVTSLGSSYDNPEQIRKQQDSLKTSLRYIDDHRPLIEDINNTGQEVKVLCQQEEAAKVQGLLDKVNSKYDEVKSDIRNRLNALAEGFHKATSEVQDAIDGMLCELTHLNNQIDNADPIASTVVKIKDQIQENKAIMEDTADRQQAIQSIKVSADDVISKVKSKEHEGLPEEERIKIDVDEIEQKISEMEILNDEIKHKTVSRGRSLEEALAAASKFWDIYNELMSGFRDIQDCINSQDSPQAESVLIQEQEKEHREMSQSLQEAIPRLEEAKKMSEALTPLIGESGKVDISRGVEEAGEVLEEIGDILEERQVALKEAMERASHFEEEIESVLSWLPKLEETISNMGPIAVDIRSIKIQIEEVKILKLQAVGKCVAIEGINSSVQALKNKSPVAAENFIVAVEDINTRWNKLVDGIFDREQALQDTLIKLGELDTSLEDVNGYLQQVEDELSDLDHVHGDPKYLETHIKKLKMVQDDLDNQEAVVTALNSSLAEMRAEGSGAKHSPLLDKQSEMNDLWKSVNSSLREKRNNLQEKLTGVKSFLGEIEDVVNWLGDFEQTLKGVRTIGALPNTAQKQCEKFNEHLIKLNAKNDAAHALLTTGEEMLQSYNCHPFQTVQIRSSLAKLRRSCDAAKKQAKKKKLKLQEHLQNVTGFHSVMKIFTDWLINGETNLSKLKTPSKLVEPIEKQIKSHRDFQEDVEAHKEIVGRLDRTGTYLKYYGAKHDAIVIRNQLLSIKLRWKRLLWKTEERGRLLNAAQKEDKRFAEDWQSLVEWLDQTKESLNKLMEQRPSPARMKEIIEEIKMFERQIGRKHPRYYATTRLGRNLKDRCTKSDPEKEVLGKMLDELKSKWTSLRTELSQKQTQLDSQLLESGRLLEASKSLIEWLEKAEDSLSEKHPIRGDQDTVHSLLEQHRAFQEELDSRRLTLNTLQQTANPEDPAVLQQLNQLNSLWSKVEGLSKAREQQLKDNLESATEFQVAVNSLRDFLPQAEQELKFQPLPEHELAIMQLMERHEKFEDQLQKVVPNVEKIKELGEEIMKNCHPNAVRFVKYYLTITHTRWEQLLERSRSRRKRLEDALDDIHGSISLLEDLLTYLSDAEVLLLTKEEDETPEDMALVEDLLKQHMEFHDELQEKGKEVEKFTSAQPEQSRSAAGYLPKLKTDRSVDDNITKIVQRELLDPNNPMVTQLLHRWREVWRMSVDRKKRLQDYLEHLLELESVRNFDFELWRQRYLAWVKTKKARITDFFRKQIKNEDGTINRDDFITGMLESKFPTNKAELNAVFNIFDRGHTGSINYREFIDALRPVTKKPKRQLSEQELVHDEIEREVSTCKCRSQFKVEKVEQGKYRFGDSQKMVLVRFLNSTVMVRVGGGWVTLQKFLENHDPCKAKGRTNTELREQFTLADGAAQSRATFTSRRHSAKTSNPGSDGGYSSASSSAAGNKGGIYNSAECLTGTPRRSLSSIHRSKVTPAQSMVNLSSNSSLYGSNGSLAGRKGAVTPTPRSTDGRVTPARRKAATPTPRGVARTPPPRR